METRIPLRLGKPLPLIPFVFHGASHSPADVDRLPLGDVIADNEPGVGLHLFLVAGRTEPAAFAGEGQEELEMRLVTSGRKELTGWTLSWMPEVRVLAPKPLRGRIPERLRVGAARNKRRVPP